MKRTAPSFRCSQNYLKNEYAHKCYYVAILIKQEVKMKLLGKGRGGVQA